MSPRHRYRPAALLALLLALAACDAVPTSPSAAPSVSAAAATAEPTASAAAGAGTIIPPPGSDSAVYAPNPAAIVVAVEAGHGGCLDWGVPDPLERGPQYSEKAITMGIAAALAETLEAEGITVVLVRDGDVALAGDLYPALGCNGAPFRDVNGDGEAGFGPSVSEATRTRDELQARLDLANLAGADVLVSLHVDSITDAAGTPLAIARTETFYTDETSWGVATSEPLARAIQDALVASLGEVADYARQDRGINAHNLYLVAPPLYEETAERPDRRKQPTRGALMPTVLVEVGSITLAAEHELLLTAGGQEAVVRGVLDGLRAWFAARPLAARIAASELDAGTGVPPAASGDAGPPFRAVAIDDPAAPVRLRLTNTGTQAWPAGLELVAGWEAVDDGTPYLRRPPDELVSLRVEVPALEPGASVELEAVLPEPVTQPATAWITLAGAAGTLAGAGSPPLQLALGTR